MTINLQDLRLEYHITLFADEASTHTTVKNFNL
jgi:hypothetical protein